MIANLTMPEKKTILKALLRVESLLGVMVMMSIAALFLPREWITRTLTLDPKNFQGQLVNDHALGGNSEVKWLDRQAHAWSCTLGPAFRDTFCSYQIMLLDENGRGLDLRKYDTMSVKVSYQGDGKYLRLYLRNRDPKYFVLGDVSTTKYNEVELPVAKLQEGLSFSLEDFRVASWWLIGKNIPLEHSHADFNDVVFLELQTGSGLKDGTHDIQLHSVNWQGPIISEEELYRYIVICWLLSIFFILVYHITKLSLALSRHRKNQDELVAVNRLLNLQNKRFEDLAKTDLLTGVLNRLGIRDSLREGLENWRRYRTPFSLVLIDIDNFKKINDDHGHDIGDMILIATAKLLRDSIRKSDLLARWGGEEFMLVCPRTNIDEAHAVAEMLRKKLAETQLHSRIKITASFGVATMSQPNLDHMFKQADEALYDAKNSGKNKVITSSDYMPTTLVN